MWVAPARSPARSCALASPLAVLPPHACPWNRQDVAKYKDDLEREGGAAAVVPSPSQVREAEQLAAAIVAAQPSAAAAAP